MCDKRELRRRFSALRAAARSPEADRLILKNLMHSPFWEADSFFVYHAVGTEAGTAEIIAALRAAGKAVRLPRICGGVMLAVPYGKLETGAYGIPAPAEGEDAPCEVALAPLLAADGEGYRLGYGGGYYDAYFAAHPDVVRVGLCYEAQRTDRLPHEAHDVPLQAVVTERGVVLFEDGSPARRG